MFYARYVLRELSRRRVRTLLTVAGLGLGVALVITISGLSRGLDRAQRTALDPLSGIGTDLTVTRGVQTDNTGFGGGGPGGGGSFRDVIQSNQSVLTDLSKLGKPGQHFVHDFFLPGTQLTFPTSQGATVSKLSGVAASAQGLLLIAEHQEGVVPKIVAKFKTGGQTFRVRRTITPLTPAEQQAGRDRGDAGNVRDLLRLVLRERQLRPREEEVVDEVLPRLAELGEIRDR